MTLESKLRALVAEWSHDEDIYTCGALGGQQKSTSHRANCHKCALEALLAERQPMIELSAEQVALAIAANKLLPDPPGGYDMEGIVKSLNGLLASASALAERQEPPRVDKLAEHWLSQMDCDHNMKRNRAVCCCGFVTIWEPTVGDAAKAWAEHALMAAAAQPSSGTGERK